MSLSTNLGKFLKEFKKEYGSARVLKNINIDKQLISSSRQSHYILSVSPYW
jgi:hypothetical protein